MRHICGHSPDLGEILRLVIVQKRVNRGRAVDVGYKEAMLSGYDKSRQTAKEKGKYSGKAP